MARPSFFACLFVLGASLPAMATCPPDQVSTCISRRAPDGTIVQHPRLHWTPIASATRSQGNAGLQLQYLQGRASAVTRHLSAAALGVPGQSISGLFFQPAGSAPILFARFAPGSNTLRIDLLRIERGTDGRVTVASAQFGPHHGERFILSQDFISASARQSLQRGINPFSAWLHLDDNLFHDICFQCRRADGTLDPYTSGVATAVGLAMQQAGASTGILAVAREWIDVQQETSGGLLFSTVKVKTYGYAQPDWWLASPIGAQAGATDQHGTCAVAGEQPCLPEHTVMAGVALAPWTGLNLPTDRDLLYYSEDSHSGFTVLGYAVVTALLVGAGSYVWGGDLLAGGGDVADASLTTLPGISASTGTATINGLLSAGGYLAGSDTLHPASPGQIQNGYLGTPYSSGRFVNSANSNPIVNDLQTKVTTLQTAKQKMAMDLDSRQNARI